jgi:hypothetical protein
VRPEGRLLSHFPNLKHNNLLSVSQFLRAGDLEELECVENISGEEIYIYIYRWTRSIIYNDH